MLEDKIQKIQKENGQLSHKIKSLTSQIDQFKSNASKLSNNIENIHLNDIYMN